MKVLLAISALLGSALAAAIPSLGSEYNGYKVFRIPTVDQNLAQVVRIIKELELDTWEFPKTAGSAADVVVSPSQLSAFEEATAGLTVEVMHEDLGASIDAESAVVSTYEAGNLTDAWFNSYHSYNDHLQFLRDLQAQYPDNSELITAGNSYERRPLQGIHIWGSRGKGKPGVVWHGTIHAREWITTMVVEYMASSLLSERSDETVKSILDKYDFFIFPITNPDGFVYSQSRSRLWRKNRQPSRNNNIGTDLNRNYPYQWEGRGSSSNPSAETFRGLRPGDSPEVQAHTRFMQSVARSQGVKMYVDWHSYSQLFLTPYGYHCSRLPRNHQKHISLATAFAQALRAVHGTSFRVGPTCNTIYQVNGDSVDWAVEVGGFELGFAAELRDTGRHGFVLPASQIKPSGEETWAGIKALMARM
ncbi:secreted carboxypeptidase McpA [Coccidioides immitis RS]|uniref:Secreted carboxypeptidase McpA n=4 Tax=Coccidioides immitis TaxID=5501 RepID=J3KJ43_COCIM|nr:secreted carboxypeptidase McpA [Coccidioides immitis RS]KMP01347.1 carboxypeptidase A1 [Coccidioides immitis RMSCC 2394]KMU81496.1 carboxypeptidase A1 [Coccidioides immitis RMSCC 3703]KMU83852.1 carboxypeptidase A1 [Coccidioides immitis H538.4]TPX25784.1 hypothetical protein DIZ76_011241 [Coccidioides immitis]EAS36042.3 secreted carboxypeptidase McpA [Coccidioides immitis RS]